MDNTKEKLELGKIYHFNFNGVELVGRVSKEDSMQIYFFSHLHYWNGFEQFHEGGYCVKSGLEGIRKATQPEQHHLFKFEVENNG